MTTLSELCRKYFNTDNLYEVLNTNKDATDKEGLISSARINNIYFYNILFRQIIRFVRSIIDLFHFCS